MAALGSQYKSFYHFPPLDPPAFDFEDTSICFTSSALFGSEYDVTQDSRRVTRISFLYCSVSGVKFDAERPCKYLQVYP